MIFQSTPHTAKNIKVEQLWQDPASPTVNLRISANVWKTYIDVGLTFGQKYGSVTVVCGEYIYGARLEDLINNALL